MLKIDFITGALEAQKQGELKAGVESHSQINAAPSYNK